MKVPGHLEWILTISGKELANWLRRFVVICLFVSCHGLRSSAAVRSTEVTSLFLRPGRVTVCAGTLGASCAARATSSWWTSFTSTRRAKSTADGTTPRDWSHDVQHATRYTHPVELVIHQCWKYSVVKPAKAFFLLPVNYHDWL